MEEKSLVSSDTIYSRGMKPYTRGHETVFDADALSWYEKACLWRQEEERVRAALRMAAYALSIVDHPSAGSGNGLEITIHGLTIRRIIEDAGIFTNFLQSDGQSQECRLCGDIKALIDFPDSGGICGKCKA